MTNPSIKELRDDESFDLIAELSHEEVKEFVFEQFYKGGKLVKSYMYYQVVMILTGILFLTRSVLLAVNGYSGPLFNVIFALLFCFTLLVVIHELLHGAALKYTGAKKISYGAQWRKFIFYAEADGFVINKKQFSIIALTPFLAVKTITLAGVIFSFHSPSLYFWIMLMSLHSLFCAGDISLLSIFYSPGAGEMYTFDSRQERKSYYFSKRES